MVSYGKNPQEKLVGGCNDLFGPEYLERLVDLLQYLENVKNHLEKPKDMAHPYFQSRPDLFAVTVISTSSYIMSS